MKKQIVFLLILLLLSCVPACAEPCPLPEPKTGEEINLYGFEWYTDYTSTISQASSMGYTVKYEDIYKKGGCYTPHWNIVSELANSFAGSEKNCGGSIEFENIVDIGGYKVRRLTLYYVLTPNIGTYDNYKDADAIQFYMGRYDFDVADPGAAYVDLMRKLQSIYGKDAYYASRDAGLVSIYWINGDGACVGLRWYDGLSLYYCAPASEERLAATEKWVNQLEANIGKEEVENAKGDLSGL